MATTPAACRGGVAGPGPARPGPRRAVAAAGAAAGAAPGQSDWSVLVATTPLVGPAAAVLAGLADAAAGAGLAPLAAAAAPHAVVILAPDRGGAAWAFDFLPADPGAPATALALAAGRAVRGVGRTRRLPRLPRARCVAVGPASGVADPLAHARAVAAGWDGAPLRVLGGGVDCVAAAVGLAAALAAVEEGVVRAALDECGRRGGRGMRE